MGCSNLKSIVIPASVTTIGAYAFSGCNNLTSVTFEEGSNLETLDKIFYNSDIAEYNSAITEFTIPKSVTEIAPWAFIGLSSLTKVVFEDDSNVTVLPTQLFDGCYNLTTVYFGKNSKIKTIDDWAFMKCVKLTEISTPKSVTKIDASAFASCKSIKSIDIPAGVTYVGRGAFSGWAKDQIINVEGYAKTPDGWSSEWLEGCNATVIWSVV